MDQAVVKLCCETDREANELEKEEFHKNWRGSIRKPDRLTFQLITTLVDSI